MTLVFLFAAFLCVWLGCDFLLLLCVSSLCVSDLRAASWKNISVSHLCTLVLGSFLRVTLIKQTTTQTEQSGRFGWCKQEVQLSVSFGRVVFSLHLFTPLKILNCTHGCTHDYHCITFTIQKQTDDSQTNLELQEASLFFVICPQADLLMYTPNGHLI